MYKVYIYEQLLNILLHDLTYSMYIMGGELTNSILPGIPSDVF